jgi:legumain
MFVNLPKNTGIYALSAANPTESSWGTYCSPDDVVSGKHIGSCLGDLFSINFVEDTDKGDYSQTLQHQFETIRKLTDKSQVLQWGDLSFVNNKIGEFLAGPKLAVEKLRFLRPIQRTGSRISKESIMDSRTMKLQSLSASYSIHHSPEIFAEMMEEMKSMERFDNIFKILS